MSSIFARLKNPALRDVTPYVPGPTREDVAQRFGLDPSQIVKLSSNENPLGVPPRALAAMETAMRAAHEYPEALAPALRKKIAEFVGLRPENVICGCGSSELHMIIIKVFTRPGDEVMSFSPSFSWYAEAAQADGRKPVIVPLDANFDVDLKAVERHASSRTRILFLPRPNNPTSRLSPLSTIASLMQLLPECIIVSDEAYIEFAPDYKVQTAVNLLNLGANLLVTRTFSKAFGLGGLRIGYALGDPTAIEALAAAKPKWNVGTVAEAAAIGALEDTEHLEETIRVTSAGREFLTRSLTEIGLRVIPDACGNFIMVDVRSSGLRADVLAERLLPVGVVIRGDFSPHHVRISVGTPDQNQKVVQAIASVMAMSL